MLIATWNVNGVRARQQRLAEWLAERKPDVACLQELKVTDEEFAHDVLETSGYKAATHGQAGWNGVAVLAKTQPEIVVRGLPGAAKDAGARFISVKTNGIEIASVYVPNGKTVANPDYKLKLAWLDVLAKHVESRADRDAPFVMGGDFNVCPADIDVYDPAAFVGETHVTPAERERFQALLDAGTVDSYRAVHPDEVGFTWWDYRAGHLQKNYGLRIDLLLATRPVFERVERIWIDLEMRRGSQASDHAPFIMELS